MSFEDSDIDLEEDFRYWNEWWMMGCYDPEIEMDLWEAKQGEINEQEKARAKKCSSF